ncbi:outer membrane protein assembly factor BamA [Asticcacaulis benevestitus]|uniref:Outer membrane protein assembly factor BamA n=1 Tax=Asticcacaulis benevestitus DSM 16100 = ATCC BAA-896 TaxID=1121022 RepID=V4Q5X6_9CAUL|nr:outer membrane protein assembly factor BamA [Asticcacaulis benevestitus]ESQ93240.1 outer membrane protein assembly complex, YaeT protein [Asticcacaulis benevestitus DSM 16100 = ATCC BAA-896]
MTLTRSLTLGVSVLALTHLGLMATGAQAQDVPAAPPVEAAPQQQQAAPAQTAYVGKIVVSGNERIDSQTIISYLPFQPGVTVDAQLIDLGVKTLYRTDLFSDVQIAMNGNEMVVTVVESPIINQVVFEGNHAMTKDKLREEVQIRPRGVFTKAKVQEDVQRIIELYRKGGRISATVTPKIVELPQKRVDLIFEINEGAKTGVSTVNFIGNHAFSDNDLKSVVVTQKSLWWKFFSSNDNYDPDRMDYDREQLRKFYTNRGYFDFRVLSAVAELTPDRKDFAISYTVDEGQKYNFGRITIKTDNDKLKAENLQHAISIRPGQLYESDRVEKAVDDLTFAAGAAGYAFVDIRPSEDADPNDHNVDLTFNVHEGARVYIDKINIVGNTQTLDRVIRRQVLVSEGDAYNKALIERSKMYVRGLGFFKDVNVTEKPSATPGKTNIEVAVEEQPTGELSFGAGFSSVQKFIIDISIAQSNFRGTGQQVRARVSTGSIQKNIDFSFTEPRFLGRDIQAGFDLFQSSYHYRGVDYSTDSFGGGVRLGYSLNGFSVLRLRYNLRSDDVTYTSSDACNGLLYSCGNGLTSSVGYSLSFDLRNDYVQPTRGWMFTLRQDFAGLGGDVKYVSSELEGHWYHGFRKDMILHVFGTAGAIVPWQGDAIRINDRFFKGGDTMRGFEYAGMGPRDTSTGYALGGQTYAIGTAELGIPNGLPEQYGLKTALFIDLGTLGGVDDRLKINSTPGQSTTGQRLTNIVDDLSLRASAGITIRWKSPMGPVQFDLSQVLSKQSYDKTESFRFSQSTQF